MKKSLKILTLILSLALLCGALVVAAFAGDASVEGIQTKVHWNFENLSEGELAYTSSQYTFSSMIPVHGAGYNFYDSKDRQGTAAIASENGNRYFQWTNDHDCVKDASTTSKCSICGKTYNGYLAVGFTANAAFGNTTKAPANYQIDDETGLVIGEGNVQENTLDKFDFMAEADVWMPEGYHFSDGKVNNILKLHTYGIGQTLDPKTGKAVNYRSNYTSNLIPNIYFGSDSNGNYVYLNHGAKTKIYVDSNSWAHVSLLLSSKIIESASGDYLEVYATLWVNGQFVESTFIGSSDTTIIGNDSSYHITDKVRCFYGGDWRLQVTSTHAGEKDGIAVDNMSVRSIEKGVYGGNLYDVLANKGNLTEWDANIYNRENMPYGNTVAINTDTNVEYDNLQYAVSMAARGETVEVCANVIGDIVINNEITLITTGYTTGNIVAGDGLSLFDDGNGEYWTEAGGTVEVVWGACECGLDVCDETHPGDVTTYVGIGGNIFVSYEQAGKSHAWTYTDNKTLTVYKLIGWQDMDGNVYTADDVITLEYVDEFGELLELYPIIESATPSYSYTKGGVKTYGFSDTITLEAAIEGADEGTTFVLLKDTLVLNSSTAISPKNNVTIDLNGNDILWVQDQNATKIHLFEAKANSTFTVTTSVAGARILSGKMFSDVANANAAQGGAVFVCANNSVVNVDGTKGLEIICAQLFLSDGANYSSVNITGGYYIQPNTAQDSWAQLQMCCFKELNLKDAIFVSRRHHIGTMGNGAAPAEGSKVTIDGCTFIGGGQFNRGDFPELEVYVTNSYIEGNIDLSERFNARGGGRATHGMAGGKWTFGAGCYFAKDISGSGVSIAEGYKLATTTKTEEYTITTNVWKYGNVEETIKFSTYNLTVNYPYTVAKDVAPITVIWNDANGNTLGTTTAIPGMTAQAPTVPVEGTEGWVNAIYTTWQNHAGEKGEPVVPEDATDGYTFKLVEGSDATYVAGKVPMYVNYTIVLHFEGNIYFPANAPEGITDVTPAVNGSVPAANRIGGGNVINGMEMKRYNYYPGVKGADNDMVASVSFNYKGQTLTYTAPGFSLGDYAMAIFNGNYSTAMNEAVLAMINYIEVGNTTSGDKLSADIKAAQDLAAEKGITIENVTIDTERVGDYSGLSEYVSGVQVAIGSQGGVQLQFIAKDPTNAAGLKISYLWESGKQYKNQTWFNNGFWYCHNTWAYVFDDDCTVQLLDANGNVVAECVYSVYDYAAAMWDKLDDNQKNLIVATLTYAKYAEAIKK